MSFVHDDDEFPDLVRIVAAARGITPGLVEKDYWVTHTLWALQEQGWRLWFKGGTSLSKGFGLIERFSEDLDVKLEAGSVAGIPLVANWKSEGTAATASRLAYFEAIERTLVVPGATVALDREQAERSHRSAMFQVRYPGAFLDDLGGVLCPFVLLEVGSARVSPFVECELRGFVHAELAETGQAASYVDNRAVDVRCVHPLVTLLEKLDAISRRFPRAALDASAFVRHYEDAASIIAGFGTLPVLSTTARELGEEMARQKQLRRLPAAGDPAFAAGSGEDWEAVRRAFDEIQPMFWGARVELEEACRLIRAWVAAELG
jgi:hypothetical protein